jgi:hypothetical protein
MLLLAKAEKLLEWIVATLVWTALGQPLMAFDPFGLV